MKSKDDKKGKLLLSMLKSAYAAWDTGAFRKNAEYDAVAKTVMAAAERLHDEKAISAYYYNRLHDEQSANVMAVHDVPDLRS